MSERRMQIGGATLALLLVGLLGVQWYRNASPPPPVNVTRPATEEPGAMARTDAPAASSPMAATAAIATSATPPPAAADASPAAVARSPSPSTPGGDSSRAPAADHGPSPTRTDPSLMVHVVGAVKAPGVYRLPLKARLDDALQAAGGAKSGADLEAVNLASFLRDGEQVRIPTLAERRALQAAATPRRMSASRSRNPLPARPVRSTARYPLATAAAAAKSAPPPSAAAATGGIVNINTAGPAELDTLPGVGPATAAAILAFRREHGPFQRVEDLLAVRGIGEKKLAAMRDRVTVK